MDAARPDGSLCATRRLPGLCVAILCALPVGCSESGREPADRPSVILISIDTLAASHLPCYGYERETAPHLAALADESLLFEHCLTNAPWTLPSHMAMLTGLYAEAHHLASPPSGEEPAMWERWHLAEERRTLAEAFRDAGYATAAFVDNAWLTERFGFAQGFDVYDATASEVPHRDRDGGIRLVRRLALDWLDSRGEEPFFLFLHAFDVHGPYGAPEPFHGRFESSGEGRSAPIGGPSDVYDTLHEYLVDPAVVAARPSVERLPTAPFRDAYDEGVAFVDAELGALLDDLRERRLLDDALVVVTADHGETMDAGHYLFGHGVLEQSVVQVPLLIKLPRDRAAGRRITTPVQLVDLYPTLAEWCGLETARAHGRSLASAVRGNLAPSVSLCEGGLMRQSCIVVDGWKLVEKIRGQDSSVQNILSTPGLRRLWNEEIVPWCETSDDPQAGRALFEIRRQGVDVDEILGRVEAEGLHLELWNEYRERPDVQGIVLLARAFFLKPVYELYDLRADPAAVRDLAGDRPELVERLRPRLEQEQRVARSARVERGRAAPALTPEQLDDLRKLGYAED